jgi:hypothetical protein
VVSVSTDPSYVPMVPVGYPLIKHPVGSSPHYSRRNALEARFTRERIASSGDSHIGPLLSVIYPI